MIEYMYIYIYVYDRFIVRFPIGLYLLFNSKKSKLLCYNMLLDVKPGVYLCDAIVDVVDSEMYLGNKLRNIYIKQKLLNLSVILKDEAITLLKIFNV